ncbi:hypothetical protein IZ6_31320 [Terrihabitans soli]|uniref:Dihydrodipicolinate reductase n=1 Tax=Terrihabitans soli TaxID=708113 RepID=A0A6S6QWU7_9HYPH|nr:hypothetical protein [Terrihabitans soli]BCJ92397.1 hypothetical protein IZ6_31320 [Terrihabitans soli]
MFHRMLFAAALVPSLAGAALAAELVPPSLLGANFFDAKPITTTDAKGRVSKIVFTPGGTLTRTSSSGKESEGKWRLSDDGFCMQAGSAKRESCYVVVKRDDGRFAAMKRSGQPFIWEK